MRGVGDIPSMMDIGKTVDLGLPESKGLDLPSTQHGRYGGKEAPTRPLDPLDAVYEWKPIRVKNCGKL